MSDIIEIIIEILAEIADFFIGNRLKPKRKDEKINKE